MEGKGAWSIFFSVSPYYFFPVLTKASIKKFFLCSLLAYRLLNVYEMIVTILTIVRCNCHIAFIFHRLERGQKKMHHNAERHHNVVQDIFFTQHIIIFTKRNKLTKYDVNIRNDELAQ